VDLLPEGRAQKDQRRPLIPLTDCLLGRCLAWNSPYPISWLDEPARAGWPDGKAALLPPSLRNNSGLAVVAGGKASA